MARSRAVQSRTRRRAEVRTRGAGRLHQRRQVDPVQSRSPGADAYAADQLFATLDTTLRRIHVPGGAPIVLSDTVGFIRDLPHDLVAAFRATLTEAADADLLLHVVDGASPERDAQIAAVDAVLAEIGAADVPADPRAATRST